MEITNAGADPLNHSSASSSPSPPILPPSSSSSSSTSATEVASESQTSSSLPSSSSSSTTSNVINRERKSKIFGVLLGHLSASNKQVEQLELKRKQRETLKTTHRDEVEADGKDSLAKKQHQKSFKETVLSDLNKRLRQAKMLEKKARNSLMKAANNLVTKEQPPILWQPVTHNAITSELLEKRQREMKESGLWPSLDNVKETLEVTRIEDLISRVTEESEDDKIRLIICHLEESNTLTSNRSNSSSNDDSMSKDNGRNTKNSTVTGKRERDEEKISQTSEVDDSTKRIRDKTND